MAGNPNAAIEPILSRITNLENLLGVNGPNANFTVKDANGIQRVRVGYLPNQDYGILFADILGNTQELLPISQQYYAPEYNTSSTSPVTIPGISVTSEIGNHCKALVRVSGVIYLPSANTSTIVGGWIGVFMNGTYVGAPLGAQFSANASYPFGGCGISVFAENQITTTDPGEFTTTLQVYSYSGQSIGFSNLGLTVTPQ
jgi:hypothetical protein